MNISVLGYFFLDYTAQLSSSLALKNKVQLNLIDGYQALLPTDWKFPDVEEVRSIYTSYLHNEVMLDWINPWPWKWDIRGVLSLLNIARVVRKFNPQIIICHDEADWRIYILYLLLSNYNWTFIVHDPQPHLGEERIKSAWERELQKELRKKALVLFVHGEALKKQLLDRSPSICPDKVHIIPHGALSIYKNTSSITSEPQTILFFGRILKYKGLETLIQIEQILASRFKNLKIVIAGRCPDFSIYENLMIDKKIYELHLGFIPRDEVAVLFERASVVALPYTEGTQSGVAAIALAFGKPMIVTSVGSLPEMVEDGESGIVIPPDNPCSLVDAITLILRDEKLRRKMEDATIQLANNRFSWQRVADIIQNSCENIGLRNV